MNTPSGSGLTLIGDTVDFSGATETSGILDISKLVGYKPGSILLTDNQGSDSSLTVLINPNATLAADYNGNGVVDAADYVLWRDSMSQTGAGRPADGNGNNQIDAGDYDVWRAHFGQTTASGAAASDPPCPSRPPRY